MFRFKNFYYIVKTAHYCNIQNLVQKACLTPNNPVYIVNNFFSSDIVAKETSKKCASVLDPDDNLDLSDYGSALQPTYNIAAYADKSVLLQELIKLGVELYKLESKPEIMEFFLKLDFEKDVKPVIVFLTENGVPPDELGHIFTTNPLLLKEALDDLEVRINYLKSKKFDNKMISNIIVKNPRWVTTPVKQIDERLGFLQQSFSLKGNEVRQIVSQVPSLGTVKKKIIIMNTHALMEEFGLDKYTVKSVILRNPSVLRMETYTLISTYEYLTKVMNVPHYLIIQQAEVLGTRKFIFSERHKFLKSLGRAQYNPKLPGYVCISKLSSLSDDEFCENVAKVPPLLYDKFLKTL